MLGNWNKKFLKFIGKSQKAKEWESDKKKKGQFEKNNFILFFSNFLITFLHWGATLKITKFTKIKFIPN